MTEQRDIVIIGLQSWDIEIGSNCRDIARELARHHRVLYVNSPLDRLTALRKRSEPQTRQRLNVIRGKQEDLVQQEQNLWVLNPSTMLESISSLRWDWMFDALNKVNNERFAREIRSAVQRLGFRDYILFNDGNMFRGFYLKEILHPKMYVYYFRDNFLAMDFWKTQGTRIQPALMAKSDLVLANSVFLAELAKKYNRNTVYVGQGFDGDLYDKSIVGPPPADIRDIRHPVVGYTGALISLRLDPEIILYLARNNPSWNIVLIGPEDEDFRASELHRLANVHFTGPKKPNELPACINHFDVCINPQKLNEMTMGNYPRKVDEYLALGKPVVATRTTSMEEFSRIVYLADTREEFANQVKLALLENTELLEKERQEYAYTHSWEKNVEKMYELLERNLNYAAV
jgi:glycosyltransferase involved in cell wall biosynthesis